MVHPFRFVPAAFGFFPALFQRAFAAFLAISLRRAFVNFTARFLMPCVELRWRATGRSTPAGPVRETSGSALSSLVTLVAAGQKSRDEIASYLASLFRGKLVRQWSHVWDTLVSYSSDLYPTELLDDIERAYQDGLVDPGYIGFDDIKRDLAKGKDQVLARLADDPHRRLVEDTVKEMGWWACFRDDRPTQVKSAGPASAKADLQYVAASPQIKSTKPNTGRNEPCPCGSGKKYKKCCGV